MDLSTSIEQGTVEHVYLDNNDQKVQTDQNSLNTPEKLKVVVEVNGGSSRDVVEVSQETVVHGEDALGNDEKEES